MTELSFMQLKRAARTDTSALPQYKLAVMGDCATQHLATALRGCGALAGLGLSVLDTDYAQIDAQTMDPGSEETGGLYSNIMKNSGFVPEFESWAIDKSRKTGDYGLIKSDYGYHLMYFVGGEEAWYRYSKQLLQNEKGLELLENIKNEVTAKITYKKIALGDLILVASKTEE